MMIDKVNLQHAMPRTMADPGGESRTGAVDVVKSFGDFLHDALDQVDAQREEANTLTHQLITGQITDVHSVMIAAEKASLALEMTVQIRNKVVEAYQEVMRIQL